MKIYTGNFANVKKYQARNLEPISIALSAKYFGGSLYRPLNPEWSFKDYGEKQYIPLYNKKVEKLDALKVLEDLTKLSQGRDIVLCCHEKEGDFCHRRLAAEWLQKELNIEVKELGKCEAKQEVLF